MRTAIVTGAGSGIGRATALRLSAMGFAVALVGRTFAALELVARQIQAANAARFVQCISADVSKSDQVTSMVARVVQEWGRIDVLVNCAGAAPLTELADLTDEKWHDILDANLSSAFYVTRAVWPIMRRQHEADSAAGGSIVNISSIASRDPFPGLGAYAVAKAGVNMLTLVAAREGIENGIRVVCIAPGGVDTPMLESVMGKVAKEHILRPEDVAAMIADVVDGSLRHSSGETLFVHRRPA